MSTIDATEITDAAAEILRGRHGGTGPVTVHETWGSSIVVEIDGLFLKASGDRSTTAETLVARRVRAVGVPAPEIIDSGTDPRLPGGRFLVMPRMPGVGFDASNATPAQIDRVITDVARYLTILSTATMPGWGWVDDDGHGTSASWPDWLVGQIRESADRLGDRLPLGFLRDARRTIAAVMPNLERGSVLNGDLGLSHVLVDPPTGAVTGLLDWAAAVIGDPLYDVATFSMGGEADDPIHDVLQPRLLAAYGAEPTDPRIGVYRAINHLSNAVWSVENGVTSWTDDLCRAAVDLMSR
jgi:aminoglycoside phosphotransferase (APT) family kinase protein